jgi:hypothetical protein
MFLKLHEDSPIPLLLHASFLPPALLRTDSNIKMYFRKTLGIS